MLPIPSSLARSTYAALATITIGVGLAVHWRGGALTPVARDVAGDALWAMMITWFMGVLAPRRPITPRAALALGICYAVEASQLVHTPTLAAIRATTPGQLVLGSGFDPRDLIAYAFGVLAAVLVEWGWNRGWRGRAGA